MKNTSSFTQKLLLIFFGLLISIIFAEVLFRISGFIANKTMIKSVKAVKNTDSRILCIGDSSTYGLGASNTDKFSYPAQLQALLNEKAHNRKFQVLNFGVPGMNSSQVLHRFRENLLEYKPDIVIAMIGINDPWNLEENNILQEYNEKGIPERFFSGFQLLLNKSRVYQFFKLIYVSSEYKDTKKKSNQISSQEPVIPDFDDKTKSKGFIFGKRYPLKSAALYNALENNITGLKLLAEENRVAIIFMKYHNTGWGGPETIINDTYANLNVPVVDQLAIFKKAEELGLNVRGKDGWHPNDFGYLLMARNIFNKMVDLKIVDSETVEIFP